MVKQSKSTLTGLFEKVIPMLLGLDKSAASAMSPAAAEGPEALAEALLSSIGPACRAQAMLHGIDSGEPLTSFAETFLRATTGPEDRIAVLAALSRLILESGSSFHDAVPYLTAGLTIEASTTSLDLQTASQDRTENFFTLQDSGQKPVALVAHSRPEMVQILADVVQKVGLDVVAYQNGRSAMQGFIEKNPAVAIIDLGLPGMHGLDLIRNLKVRNQTVPLVILSDHADMAGDFEVKTYPSFLFLPAPAKPTDIAQALKELGVKHNIRMQPPTRTRALPGSVIKTKKYVAALRGASSEKAEGFDVAAFLKPHGTSFFEFVDFVGARSGATAVLLLGSGSHDDDGVVRARRFQAAVWMVAPWMDTVREIMLQAGALLGEDFFRNPLPVLLALLDPRTHQASVVSAGYPQALLYRQGTPDIHALGKPSKGLGMGPQGANAEMAVDTVDLDAKTLLLLTSPGLLGASSPAGEAFGWEPLKGILFTASSLSPKDILDTLAQEMDQFLNRASSKADLSAVAVTAQI